MARARPDSPPLFDLAAEARFLVRDAGDRRRPVAGRRHRRGRARAAGRAGGRRGRRCSIPKRIPDGLDDSKRLTAAAARGAVRGDPRRPRSASAWRRSAPRASTAATSARRASRPCAARWPACPSRRSMALADGRDVPPGLPCDGTGADQGRPALAVDRRRLDRRQGDARPHDAAAAAAPTSATASRSTWATPRSAIARRSSRMARRRACTA